MSAATKKPLSNGVNRLSSSADSNGNSSPSRQPRTSTAGSSGSGAAAAASTPTRARSVRGSTPVSARAAATRTSSSLSNSSNTGDNDAARAEHVALVDDLKDRLQKADAGSEQHRKQAEVLQSRLDDAQKEQNKLEERVHESEEQMEALRNEKREAARQIREMETIYEAERSSMLKEKEEMSNREEEMQSIITRLKENLNQRNADEEYRPSRQSNNSSPNVDSGNFAPPSSIQRSDSRNSSKILLQKDKLIESLRLELAEAQIKLVESENSGGGRLHEVERLLMEARMANARLMEDNESYQLLLQEKTLHGDFGKGDFSYMGAPAHQDALNALEGRPNSGIVEPASASGTSLADELGAAAEEPSENNEDHTRRLEAEVKAGKDQNKALTLYINKIIERLLQHQEFEHILDQSSEFKPGANTNKDLPAPPADAPGVGASLLQRAKSIATGAGNPARGGKRNSSMMMPPPAGQPIPTDQPSANTNPDTAPRIPFGPNRNQSVRRSRPMSEQLIGAAGVVNAMYKGPDGPLSPTLTNPRNSQTFFSPRQASTSNGAPSAGNFPGSMRSETSSVSGDSITGGDGTSTTSTTQSPPRASSSSGFHEKNTKFAAGNKPRPLRLVQENAENAKAEAANKRSSWMGWASSAWGKKDEQGQQPSLAHPPLSPQSHPQQQQQQQQQQPAPEAIKE